MKQIKNFLKCRAGPGLTSTVIGIAVLGMVGATVANMISAQRTADVSLSASADAAAILDTYASDVRNTTPYHEIENKFGLVGGTPFLVGDGYEVRTSVNKVCNTDIENSNCDLTDVVIDVYDRVTGDKVASQTVRRVYTHFSEEESFSLDEDFVLPEDAIGFFYESEGGQGAVGTGVAASSNLLQVRTKACATNYQPSNNVCVACPAPSGTKQYRSGDCTIGTCPTGKQANSARTGCVAITCPSGQTLVGDSCIAMYSLYDFYNPCSRSAKYVYNAGANSDYLRDWLDELCGDDNIVPTFYRKIQVTCKKYPGGQAVWTRYYHPSTALPPCHN